MLQMKNQNSISNPTVIIKPSPSVSAITSSRKENLTLNKMMESENNQHNFSSNINNNSAFTETSSRPLTDKVKKSEIAN